MCTPGLGIEYEVHVPAYFALKLNAHRDVEDFTLESNLSCFGNLDDLFVDVKMRNGRKHYFAFQLKHKDPKKKKKLLPTNFTADGDFNLEKYCDSFVNLKKRKRRYNFILYSNIQFDHRKINQVSDFRMISVPHKKHFLNASFFDESRDSNGVYKFVAKNNTDQKFKQFFPKLSLLVRQRDERSVANCIIKIFTDEYGVDEQIAVNYINVFRKWHKNEYTNKKLNKKMLNLLLCDLLLSPFIITIPRMKFLLDEKIELLQSSIRQFDVTIVEDSKQNFIEEMNKIKTAQTRIYTPEVEQLVKKTMKKFKIKNANNDFDQILDKCLLCLAKDMKLVDKFATELLPQDNTKFLHLILEVPLIVEFNQSSELLIYKLRESYPQRQLVLVGLGVNTKRFSQLKTFISLDDLWATDPNLFLKIVSKYKIKIQDRDEIALKELIMCDADFRKAIGLKQLYKMALGNLSVSDKTEKLPKTYIPRTLSLTYLGVGKVLEHIFRTNDLLIIRRNNNLNQILNQITLKGMNVVTIDQFDDNHYHEVVIFDNEIYSKEIYDGICTKTRRSVFVVEVVDARSLILIMSTGTIELKQLTLSEGSVNEDNIFTHFEYPTNFVCAQPGMGKSTLFNYLKNKCPTRFWSVYVDLKEHSEFFKKNPSATEIVDRFLNDLNEDSFCKKLKKLFVEKKRICFFFDGLDELEYSSVDNVLDSVNELTSTGYRVWLSSRENLLKKIEDKLNIFPIRINEFTKEEQEDYIRKSLQNKYSEVEIVVILEKIFTSNNVVKNCRILGVPLQLYILTQIFQEDRQQYEELHEDIFLLTKLYQIYFKGRHRHLLNKLRSSSSHLMSTLFLTSTLVQYEIPAIQSCLGNEIQMVLPRSNEFLKQVKQEGDPFGIITKFDDAGKPVFDHETYAEFFACKWLSKNLDKVRMLGRRLFHVKYQNLRLILDIMLAEDSPLHLAVIYKDMEQFRKHCAQEVPKDKGGRTPLHLACHGIRHPALEPNKTWYRYDNYNIDPEELEVSKSIIQDLISIYDAEEKDELFGFDPLDYAIASQCLTAIETILDKHYVLMGLQGEVPQSEFHEVMREILEKLKDIYESDKEIIITYYSSKFGYENLMHMIINAPRTNFKFLHLAVTEDINIINNMTKKVFQPIPNVDLSLSLHLAVRGNHRNIVNQLIMEKVDINAISLDYETPLHVAVKAKNLQMIDFLLAHGASTNTSPLISPILKSAFPEIFNLLVRKGADINTCSHNKMTLLHFVAEEGNVAIIDLLLDKGIDINATDDAGRTPLHLAAAEGQYHVIKKLLEKGANINSITKKKRTALHYAVIKGNKEIVQLLLEENININAQDANGSTALHLAIEFHCFEIICLLLDSNASLDLMTNCGESVLHYAAIGGNINVIRLLLAKGVTLNEVNTKKESALHLAALNCHYAATNLLIQNGADLNEKTHKERTILHYAAKGGNTEIVKLILKEDFDVNVKDGDGISALHLAIKFKHFTAVKCLIENGGDVNASSNFGEISLHFACVHGMVDLIKVLLTNGAEINSQNKNGETPLHIAVRYRHFQAIAVLLAKGADVNVRTNRSETPLHYAAEQGITEIVKLLINRNVDINAVDVDGQAPLHLAIKDGYLNVTELLIDTGADVNILTVDGQTALHYASTRAHYGIFLKLLWKPVPVNASDVNGITALHLAAKSGNFKITTKLVEKGAVVEAITKKNETTLHYAVKGGNLETIKSLARRVSINVKNDKGVTSLHLAMEQGSSDVVKYLIDKGADTEAVTLNEETMLHFVARGGNCYLLDQIVQRGAQVNARDKNGVTPLHVAVEYCKIHAARSLLEKGADINAKNRNGETPLEIARGLGEPRLIHLLETFGVHVLMSP